MSVEERRDRPDGLLGRWAQPVVRLDRIVSWQGSRRSPVTLEAVEEAVYDLWRSYAVPR